MSDALIMELQGRLAISHDASCKETEAFSQARAVYSAIGAMGSTCLWNDDEYEMDVDRKDGTLSLRVEKSGDHQGVSMLYWRNYVKKLFHAYLASLNQIQLFFPIRTDQLIAEVYDITPLSGQEKSRPFDETEQSDRHTTWTELLDELLETQIQAGIFYKKDRYIAPVTRRSLPCGRIAFERGLAPDEVGRRDGAGTLFSGLGAFSVRPTSNNAPTVEEIKALEDYLALPSGTPKSYFAELTAFFDSSAKRETPPSGARYLRLSPRSDSEWGSYWLDSLEDGGGITLARFGERGRERYFLYRRKNGESWICDLPERLVNPEWKRPAFGSREYLRIAAALLAGRDRLPPITARVYENVVDVQLGYLVPPAELAFFKLYSWPVKTFRLAGQNFERRMDRRVYEAFKALMEFKGWRVEERL